MAGLVIFDFDGVIVDSCPFYFRNYRLMTEHFGRTFPCGTLQEFREWYDSAWENNFLNLGFPEEDIPALLEYQASLTDYNTIPLFPDIKEVIADMAGRYTLAIASTTKSSDIRKKLSLEGLENLFALISGGDEGTSEKKSKIGLVLTTLGRESHEAVMIGDTVMDITSSRALGIKNIAVLYGWNTLEKLLKAAPDHSVRSPWELVPLIGSIFPQ
ncbi:MAG: HAD family hydrolase [Candidatus Eremiobacteraeota bacterium]|nr:HAD family hydrolase [Candidatus Eremiobacteraeota bacterium]